MDFLALLDLGNEMDIRPFASAIQRLTPPIPGGKGGSASSHGGTMCASAASRMDETSKANNPRPRWELIPLRPWW